MNSTRVTNKDGVTVLRPKQDLTGGTETDDLELLLKDSLAHGAKYLIVDLKSVSIVNSAGLRALETGLQVSQTHGAQFKVCNATRRIRWFVAQFAIIRLFEVHETVSEAISNLRSECATEILEELKL